MTFSLPNDRVCRHTHTHAHTQAYTSTVKRERKAETQHECAAGAMLSQDTVVMENNAKQRSTSSCPLEWEQEEGKREGIDSGKRGATASHQRPKRDERRGGEKRRELRNMLLSLAGQTLANATLAAHANTHPVSLMNASIR